MRKTVWIKGASIVCAITILSNVAYATTNDLVGQEFITQSANIHNFLFGRGMWIVAGFGAAIGLTFSLVQSSLKPLLVFGGIGLAAKLVPAFISGVFDVSGMLLP